MSEQNEQALDQLEHEALIGEEARQLLENRIFKAAWDEAEKSILMQMEEVTFRDTEMHSRLVMALKILRTVRGSIEQAVQAGQAATVALRDPRAFGLFPRKK